MRGRKLLISSKTVIFLAAFLLGRDTDCTDSVSDSPLPADWFLLLVCELILDPRVKYAKHKVL